MPKTSSNLKKQHGFTMVELLVVATVIVILISIGMVSYRSAARSSRNGKRKGDLATVRQALMLYRAEHGFFPDEPNYDDMIDELQPDFLNTDQDYEDPLDEGAYQYSYTDTTGTCTGDTGTGPCDFTLEANLETSSGVPELYSVSSP